MEELLIMKKVYFYLMFNHNDSYDIDECWKSENFNSIEEAFESKEQWSCKTSPIMEGWIKE